MAKLLRNSKSKTQKPASDNTGEKQSNPALAIGLVLAVVTGLAIFIFTNQLQGKDTILIAKKDISPYTIVSKNDLEAREVPKGSVDPIDLTPEEFNQLQSQAKGGVVVSRIEIVTGQRVPQLAFASNAVGTVYVTKPGKTKEGADATKEVNVAGMSSLAGVVGGIVIPGSVVDVYVSGGSGSTNDSGTGPIAENIKVLGVGYGAEAGAEVRPNQNTRTTGKQSNSGSSGNIILILAVPSDIAGQIADQQIALALHPHESFDLSGEICGVSDRSLYDKCDNKNLPNIENNSAPSDTTTPSTDQETSSDQGAATDENTVPASPTTDTNTTTQP